MRTRCPRCATIFRVTPEQLRFRAGKVRCGHCQAVFNALDTLIEETAPPAPQVAGTPVSPPLTTPSASPPPGQPTPGAEPARVLPEEPLAEPRRFVPAPEPVPAPVAVPAPPPAPEPEPVAAPAPAQAAPPTLGREPEPEPQPEPEPAPRPVPTREHNDAPQPTDAVAPQEPLAPPVEEASQDPTDETVPPPPAESHAEAVAVPVGDADVAPNRDETPEETTQAARQAGLVAARELSETPGYSRWAASPLAGVEAEKRQRVTWPFTLAAVLLSLTLAGQLAYYFRTELSLRLPDAGLLFAALGVDVPLPHDANLISIEASDLQSDAARGLLVLQATLKNRAPHAQSWPALELTLTDTHDTVVARRVLYPADYLPPGADPNVFAPNGETAIKLWIEAKDVAAVGYRLYVFYP